MRLIKVRPRPRSWTIMPALRSILRPYYYKQSLYISKTYTINFSTGFTPEDSDFVVNRLRQSFSDSSENVIFESSLPHQRQKRAAPVVSLCVFF